MVTFDFALDTVMQLPKVDRENLIEIINKRRSQDWRKETAEYYHDLKYEIDIENIKPISADEAINDLHNYINIFY
jgi:hypothetical protein